MSAPGGPLGIMPGRVSLPLGVVTGSASFLAGALLVVAWGVFRFVPAVQTKLPPLPFFFELRRWDGAFVGGVQLVAALVLLVIGWAVLTRRRWAPLGFLLCGWGGVVFTAFAFWPTQGIRVPLRLYESYLKKQGNLPGDGTLLDLVSTSSWVLVGAFLAVWLVLLVLGAWHVGAQRHHYTR